MDCDAVVVGGSLAGCTAATLLARAGWRVALVERRPQLNAYKQVCTHNLQPCATPVLARLGVLGALREAGAVATHTELWTRYGWVQDPWPGLPGYNVRREILDPVIRRTAIETPRVRWMGGAVARALIEEGGRARGVVVTVGDRTVQIRARLVVGADGRNSRIGKLAGLPLREWPHRRFVYWSYWRGVPSWGSASRMWLLDPVCAYAFPNDGGRTLLATFVPREDLRAWKTDLERAYLGVLSDLPGGPDLSGAHREGPILGRVDMPNATRLPVGRGVALAGDAAMAADPLWGVGCGWALQSAAWLADAVAPYRRRRGLRAGLWRYRLRHAAGLGDHFALTSSYSTGRRFTRAEQALYQAAAQDPVVAHALLGVGARTRKTLNLLRPALMARVWAQERGQAGGTSR